MLTKKRIVYFGLLFLPMLIISMLANIAYSLNAHNYLQINWFVVIVLSIVLDALLTWIQTRKEEGNKPDNSVH
jgi:hypothetical protein